MRCDQLRGRGMRFMGGENRKRPKGRRLVLVERGGVGESRGSPFATPVESCLKEGGFQYATCQV